MTMVQKGCWTGPSTGEMLSNNYALPPDYSVVRGCQTDWCNDDLMTHDTIPNLSPGVTQGWNGRGREERGRGLRGAPPPRALAI